ncbi:MAG: nicotinamide-nucleotide amidohydrolase family protein [Candidatus Eremiobacteraeota bacterium]|nr:nicotinamide-nucleotide amidohydrolase family protein [Candidatus Eremiobacteraeota bacterium]
MQNHLVLTIKRLCHLTHCTVSVAESCTGGIIAGSLTSLPGSSAYFIGGVVTYSNRAKTSLIGVPEDSLNRYGAVSREVALEMARGVRELFGTTFGLSVTGIAGPSGATAEKPVGLVFIGVSDPRHTQAFRFMLKGSRRQIRAITSMKALRLLVKVLDGYRGGQ